MQHGVVIFDFTAHHHGCFLAVLALHGRMRAVRCSTRRVRVRKTPRALLARARGDEMLTRFQRAPRIKLRPFGTYQRVFVAYLVAPAYLDLNRSKNKRKPSWWSRFINVGAFPPSPPSLAQNEAVFEACFGCQVWGLARPLERISL